MKLKLKKIFVSLFCLVSLITNAQKYSNEFLNIGVGARSLAMGNASVASVSDVTSGYWNPAGLLGIKSNLQIGLMHNEYFASIAKYDYLSLGVKMDSVSAGSFSFIRFGIDDIPNTLDLVDASGNVNYGNITKFSVVDWASIFSYARKIKQVEGLNVGGSIKLVRRKAGNFGGAWGFGIDAGAQYSAKGWKFGAMFKDISGTYNAWSYTLDDKQKDVFIKTGNAIPSNSIEVTKPMAILGISKRFNVYKQLISVQPELNTRLEFDGLHNVLIKSKYFNIDPVIGCEIDYKSLVYLRFGFNNFQKFTNVQGEKKSTIQPNMGIGLKLKKISLDYALTNIGSSSIGLYSNVFSLKINIDKQAQ